MRFIRKLVRQYVQTVYNLYADSCGFMWIHVDFKDSHNDGSGIRGGSIVESVCCPHGDGWTAGDVLPIFEMVSSWLTSSAPVGGSWKTLPISDMPSVAVVSVPASVADGCPRSLSGCRQGLRMAPHDDDGDFWRGYFLLPPRHVLWAIFISS